MKCNDCKNYEPKDEPKYSGNVWWSGVSNIGEQNPIITTIYETDPNAKWVYRVLDSDKAMLWVDESELRGVGDDVEWDGIDSRGRRLTIVNSPLVKITHISQKEIQIQYDDSLLYTTPEHLSTKPIEVKPERPEPKFHVGQETDKGVIKEVFWCSLGKNPFWGYTMVDDGKVWDKNQLTALPKPSITITLFKIVWRDGKNEVEIEDHLIDNLKLKSHDKNYLAELYFSQGYCAIRIDYGDGHSERRYSPEIEVLFINSDLWYFLLGWKEIYDSGIIEKELYKIINLKRWTII